MTNEESPESNGSSKPQLTLDTNVGRANDSEPNTATTSTTTDTDKTIDSTTSTPATEVSVGDVSKMDATESEAKGDKGKGKDAEKPKAKKIIKVSSSEGQIFEVEEDVIFMSVLIKHMVEDLADDDDSAQEAIPLPNVTAEVLTEVLKWCEEHRGEDPPDPEEDEFDYTKKRMIEIPEWDEDFFERAKAALPQNARMFEIILAANYLDIKALLDVGCLTAANMIKGRSPEEIREMFGIENDLTEADVARIKKENAWAMDM